MNSKLTLTIICLIICSISASAQEVSSKLSIHSDDKRTLEGRSYSFSVLLVNNTKKKINVLVYPQPRLTTTDGTQKAAFGSDMPSNIDENDIVHLGGMSTYSLSFKAKLKYSNGQWVLWGQNRHNVFWNLPLTQGRNLLRCEIISKKPSLFLPKNPLDIEIWSGKIVTSNAEIKI